MVKKNFLMTAPLLMASFCSAQEKPNVVLIMVDDMGYSDIGCYGGEILTPNIDALASKGVRFTQFYNTSRSCPARASLMTGYINIRQVSVRCPKTRLKIPARRVRMIGECRDTKDSSTAIVSQ